MNLKRFGKNTIVYGIGNVCLRASAFLLIPLYTHALSVKDYGILCTLLLTIEVTIIIMSAGTRTSVLRFCEESEARGRVAELLGSALLINLMVGLSVLAIILLTLRPVFASILHIVETGQYLALAGSTALLQSLSLLLMSYYQAKGDANRYTVVGVSAAILLLLSNLLFLFVLELGLIGALLSSILTYSVVFALLFVDVLVLKTGMQVALRMIIDLLRFGFPLIFSMLGELLMASSSIYFLSYYQGSEVVAVYSLGYKLATILGILLTLPFQLAYQPFVFANIHNPDLKKTMGKILTYFLLAVALVSLGILLLSRLALPFIAPPEYSGAYLITLLLLPAIALKGIYIFGDTLLGVSKKTHLTGTITGSCGLLSILLNYALIPVMGWHGAIIASVVSCLVAALTILIIGNRMFPMHIEWIRSSFAAGIFFSFLILAFALQQASTLVYCGAAVISACLIVPFGSFFLLFDDSEKIAIRRAMEGISPFRQQG